MVHRQLADFRRIRLQAKRGWVGGRQGDSGSVLQHVNKGQRVGLDFFTIFFNYCFGHVAQKHDKMPRSEFMRGWVASKGGGCCCKGESTPYCTEGVGGCINWGAFNTELFCLLPHAQSYPLSASALLFKVNDRLMILHCQSQTNNSCFTPHTIIDMM